MKIMSSKTEEGEHVCANCGIAGVDNIKLEECSGCDLVKYCGDKCQGDHREQHEEECTNRKAELHDRKLMQQPDGTHLGEYPLCFLPMLIDPLKSIFHTCCSNTICRGCLFAHVMSNRHDSRCPFCREPHADDEEEHKGLMKRVKANDPAAMSHAGGTCYDEGDYEGSFEYYKKAAELGDAVAHYRLALAYRDGEGVKEDEEKMVYHWEVAAIGGHPYETLSWMLRGDQW